MDAAATCSARLAYDDRQIARYVEGADSRYISDVLMREIYLRDNGTCQKCSRAVGPRAAHFDHITPWSASGDTVPWNLQILCEPCNRAKGNRMDAQDYRKLDELNAYEMALGALIWTLGEWARRASMDDTLKPFVRRVVQDLRDLCDAIERAADEGEAERRAAHPVELGPRHGLYLPMRIFTAVVQEDGDKS